MIYFISSVFHQKNALTINKTDLLLIIDAFWQITYTENKLFFKIQKKLKKKGGKVAYLIYDIIPVTNKEVVSDAMVNVFEKSFNKLIKYADFYITISRSEQRNIDSYLKSQKINKPIEYFYLGADLPKCEENESIQSDIAKIIKNPYFLIVGTIEPRKGHSIVIEAFEYLWNEGFGDSLVIVGKPGWASQKLFNHILNSTYYNNKLFMFNNCNDSELNFLYNNTKALIFASQREGFGLPLVEAMQYKKPIIASDIEVFKELKDLNVPISIQISIGEPAPEITLDKYLDEIIAIINDSGYDSAKNQKYDNAKSSDTEILKNETESSPALVVKIAETLSVLPGVESILAVKDDGEVLYSKGIEDTDFESADALFLFNQSKELGDILNFNKLKSAICEANNYKKIIINNKNILYILKISSDVPALKTQMEAIKLLKEN
ncbi:glycosyltransferase family 1 protein [Desulfurella sp.]|uniref:glycosyltransferase family 4 protein n=1 Tax=Desulfurella sp. TaxID=1962857 RepID=UPI0025C4742A|nr:glycosyltransferase family 1 protein [Desulfurella sp.]